MSVNTMTISGRLGGNPEQRTTSNNNDVTSFSVAVDRRKADAGPLWFRVSCWGQNAAYAAQYLSRGSEVVVTGRLDLREYTDKDGEKQFSLELDASTVQGVGRPRDDQGGNQANDDDDDAGLFG